MTQPVSAFFNKADNIDDAIFNFKNSKFIPQGLTDQEAVVAFAEGILEEQAEALALNPSGLYKLIALDKKVAPLSPETGQKLYKLFIEKICPDSNSLSALEERAIKYDVLSNWPGFEAALYKLNQLISFFIGKPSKPPIDRHSERQVFCLQYFELFANLIDINENPIRAMNLALRLAGMPLDHSLILNKLRNASLQGWKREELRKAIIKLCGEENNAANPMRAQNAMEILELLDTYEITQKNTDIIAERILKDLDGELTKECINTFKNFSDINKNVTTLELIANTYKGISDVNLRKDIAKAIALAPSNMRTGAYFQALTEQLLKLNPEERTKLLNSLRNTEGTIGKDVSHDQVRAPSKSVAQNTASSDNESVRTDVQSALEFCSEREKRSDPPIAQSLTTIFSRMSDEDRKEFLKMLEPHKGVIKLYYGISGYASLLGQVKDQTKHKETIEIMKRFIGKGGSGLDYLSSKVSLRLSFVNDDFVFPILKISDLIPKNVLFQDDSWEEFMEALIPITADEFDAGTLDKLTKIEKDVQELKRKNQPLNWVNLNRILAKYENY